MVYSFIKQSHGHIMIDACPKCKGVWLDAGELEAVLDVRLDGRCRQVEIAAHAVFFIERDESQNRVRALVDVRPIVRVDDKTDAGFGNGERCFGRRYLNLAAARGDAPPTGGRQSGR